MIAFSVILNYDVAKLVEPHEVMILTIIVGEAWKPKYVTGHNLFFMYTLYNYIANK